MPLDGHDQSADAQLGPEVVGHGPADDLARGHVLDRGQIQEALVGRDVGDVGQPDLVRPVRGEVPRQQVRGDRETMAAVRGSGCTAAAPAGREPHLAHQPRDASARMPQPFPAQLGVDAWRAVDPPAGGEDAADLLAQLGFRLGTALDGGDRVEPSVEAADARTDDSAQRGHGVARPLGRYEGELRHAIPLAKKAAALRRISTSSSSRFTSRFSRCVSACSALLGRGTGRAHGGAGGNAATEARGEAARRGGGDPPQGGGFFRQGDRVTKFAFVSAERANHAVAMLCRVIGASVSGFYAWLRVIPTVQNRAEAEAELREQIGRVFAARRRVYGSPRVHAELRREGLRHSRRRVARLMREMGLSARRGRRRTPRTTDSRHDLPVAPNLLARNFTADGPDQVWLADISYIPTDEGFLYLAAIKDMATREIVGWSMADHLRAELCIGALVMAIQRHRPSRGLVHHGDRGVQYASEPCWCKNAAPGLERGGGGAIWGHSLV